MIPKALDYFEKIYLHRSLNKACVELGISQPALSKSLRALAEPDAKEDSEDGTGPL